MCYTTLVDRARTRTNVKISSPSPRHWYFNNDPDTDGVGVITRWNGASIWTCVERLSHPGSGELWWTLCPAELLL
eukprot:scaffold3855_cov144-Amphora_coffeaeformis.AAC.2